MAVYSVKLFYVLIIKLLLILDLKVARVSENQSIVFMRLLCYFRVL